MARPRKKVDETLLAKLCRLHLSLKVISDIIGVHEDTLHRRFAAKMDLWRSESKSKMADVLFDEAVNKRTPWALKALVQRHLDYSDKVDVESSSQVIQINIEDQDKKL